MIPLATVLRILYVEYFLLSAVILLFPTISYALLGMIYTGGWENYFLGCFLFSSAMGAVAVVQCDQKAQRKYLQYTLILPYLQAYGAWNYMPSGAGRYVAGLAGFNIAITMVSVYLPKKWHIA